MKGRDWATIAYIENMNIELICDILEEQGVICAISPLHDKDIYTDKDYNKWKSKYDEEPDWKIGEYKKAHYHILMHFNGPTTYNNVKNICDTINATAPKKVINNGAYYKYLCHLENKDKAQYNIKDIRIINDFQITLTDNEELALSIEVIGEIQEKQFKEYRQVVDYYKDIGDTDRFKIVKNNCNFFKTYLNSKRWENKEENK